MASCFKVLSKIDKITKYSVYGWIREAEIELKIEHFPMILSSICILYYREDEIFDPNKIGDKVKLSNTKKIITAIRGYGNETLSNYAITEISSMRNIVCRWDLKLNQKNSYTGIRVGVSSLTQSFGFSNGLDKVKDGHAIYMYSSWGKILDQKTTKWRKYGKKSLKNDTISIILDLRRGQINYLVNGKDQGIAYKDIQKSDDIKYRLIVFLGKGGHCLEILNFSIS